MLSEYLIIGQVARPQGIRGEVKVQPITSDIGRFEDLETVYMKTRTGEYVPHSITVNRLSEDAVYLRFEGCDTRDDAEKLRNELLYIDRAHALALDEDSNFLVDLYGLRGVVSDGRDRGKIVEVMQPGGNDVYVFRGGPLGEVLVPALKSVVLSVDLEAGEMRLDGKRLDEVGLFNDN